MADRILNINGELIRLKDNGDGTWSWATSLTGRKIEAATVINAVSVPAVGDTGWVSLGRTDDAIAFVAIAIDQQPWTAFCGAPWGAVLSTAESLHPRRVNVATTYPTTAPALSLVVVPPLDTELPTTWDQALVLAGPAWSGQSIRVANNSASVATVTVKVIKVWR